MEQIISLLVTDPVLPYTLAFIIYFYTELLLGFISKRGILARYLTMIFEIVCLIYGYMWALERIPEMSTTLDKMFEILAITIVVVPVFLIVFRSLWLLFAYTLHYLTHVDKIVWQQERGRE